MFGNSILELLGNKDPMRTALGPLAQPSATQAGGGNTQAGPTGMPGTTPAAAPQQPQAYQSPPQLLELYSQLQERQQIANMIDTGAGLVASAFSPNNRGNIMSSVGGGGGGSPSPEAQMSLLAQVMNMEQARRQAEAQAAQRAALRSTLPDIAARHNLDVNTASLLFESGDLEKVLSDLSKPDNQIVELADGTQAVVNRRTGAQVSVLGPQKVENEVVQLADGRQAVIDKRTGKMVSAMGPQTNQNQFIQLANGQWALANKANGSIGAGMGPEKSPDMTSDERTWRADNADRATRGMPERSFSEFLSQTSRDRAGAANLGPNNINYGEPPKDMAWKRNGDGSIAVNDFGAPIAIPIAGSKLSMEQEDAARKRDSLSTQKGRTNDVVTENIDRVLKAVEDNASNTFPLTGASSIIGNIPMATPHRDMQQNLETVKANIGFDKLQEMRAASPTGGALGQVSDFENKLLQSTFGSLDPTQSREQFERNLRRIRALYSAVIHKGVKDEEEARRIEKQADVEAIPLEDLLKQYGSN